jgi:membrane protease YdiL (CAAX protease family)
MNGDAAPALSPAWRVLGTTAIVTALVTALSWLLPSKYAGTGVGLGFLAATWFLCLRGEEEEVAAHGLALGGLFERDRLSVRRLASDGGRALLFAGIVALVIFPPFVIGYRMWWSRAVGHPLVWQSARVLTKQMSDDVLGQVLVIALPEEAFFRGYLQTELDRLWPPRVPFLGAKLGPSLLVTSAIFAVGHVLTQPDPSRLAVFFPSLLFGWMRARSRGIGASVFLHASCNLFVTLLSHGFGLAR